MNLMIVVMIVLWYDDGSKYKGENEFDDGYEANDDDDNSKEREL